MAKGRPRTPIAERFWPRVQKGGPGECWEWMGGRFPTGYGACWDGDRTGKAHRISWEMAHGSIPNGMCVLHRCDNPPCVNPDHLFLGTIDDNNRDMMAKGRGVFPGPKRPATGDRNGSRTTPASRPRGERVATAKLTESQAKEIIRLAAAGKPRRVIAALFGIHYLHVCRIFRGGCWKHLKRPNPPDASR